MPPLFFVVPETPFPLWGQDSITTGCNGVGCRNGLGQAVFWIICLLLLFATNIESSLGYVNCKNNVGQVIRCHLKIEQF